MSRAHGASRLSGCVWLAVICMAAGAMGPGCAIERKARSEAALSAHRREVVEELVAGRERLSRTAVARILDEQRRAEAGGPEPVLDFLILSGGGDYGAFGAGVLKGWGTVTDPAMARPEFDVVSGVSTGALIAPLAFVGTEEAYERAFQVYQNPKPAWSETRGLVTSLLTNASFAKSDWLRQEIEQTIDDPMIRAIAQGHDENRVLVIGTTNIDLGLLVMWDAALIADEIVREEWSRSRLDDVVLASASIPAVFPPVEIDGDLYVDGGVMRNIAYTTDQQSEDSVINIWLREHGDRPLPKIRLWIIINNQLATPTRNVDPGWPAQIGRALEISIRSSTISSLKGLSLAAQVAGTQEKIQFEFRFVCIPDEWKPPVKGNFKKETMVSLAQLGLAMGADAACWRTGVPDPESPER